MPIGSLREDFFIPGRKFVARRKRGGKGVDQKNFRLYYLLIQHIKLHVISCNFLRVFGFVRDEYEKTFENHYLRGFEPEPSPESFQKVGFAFLLGALGLCSGACVEFALHPQHETSSDSEIQTKEDFKSELRKRLRSLSMVP